MQEYATLTEFNEFTGGFWFTLAFINAGLAQGKNRSGLLWFFLSFTSWASSYCYIGYIYTTKEGSKKIYLALATQLSKLEFE